MIAVAATTGGAHSRNHEVQAPPVGVGPRGSSYNSRVADRKRLFVSFAAEDAYARDFLRGQAANDASPFEFVDMSVKSPFDENWKTQVRSRMKGCDGVIALLSRHTAQATGARWEMWCARDERKPLLGVQISKDDPGAIPPELIGSPVINWTWAGIAQFINRL